MITFFYSWWGEREGTCELFPQDAIQEWNEMNERQVFQIQAQLFAPHGQFPQRGQICPNCRQFNLKVKRKKKTQYQCRNIRVLGDDS